MQRRIFLTAATLGAASYGRVLGANDKIQVGIIGLGMNGFGQHVRGLLKKTIDEYERRLSYEIEMIKKMKYPGYFLITWDFIRYAREQGIPVGPGRGSAAGSSLGRLSLGRSGLARAACRYLRADYPRRTGNR